MVTCSAFCTAKTAMTTAMKAISRYTSGIRSTPLFPARPGCAERAEEALHDGLSDDLGARPAELDAPFRQRDHRLRHGAVAAGRAEVAEGGADHLTRALDVADVPDGDVRFPVGDSRH